ncbi:MAG: methyltransferase domain-containing protein [bacterium]|nr:methyltransferase domain-containing protein [bacterium]
MSAPPTDLFMHEHLKALEPGARVLDLGCGGGSFRYADFAHLQIAALDLERPAEADAWPQHVRFQQGSAEALPFSNDTFALVLANFVYEHTQDFTRAIVEAERVLVPGGTVYLSVPNAKSFEDDLYRALFAGGGHLQRFGLPGILRKVYAHTGLKLMAFADWPAGFTFFEGREGLRQFTLALVAALRRSGRADLALRSNFMMAFRKMEGIGYRTVARVCTYCGSGGVEELPAGEAGPGWECRSCGRTWEPRPPRLDDLDRLEAEAQGLLSAHPHKRGATSLRPPDPRGRSGWLDRLTRRVLGLRRT